MIDTKIGELLSQKMIKIEATDIKYLLKALQFKYQRVDVDDL